MKNIPSSIEAENGVLGSVLLSPQILSNLNLTAGDFYDRRNSMLWSALKQMEADGAYIDSITISEHLSKSGILDRIGGYDKLASLQSDAIVPSHSAHYEAIILEKSELRRQYDIVTDASERILNGENCSDEVISSLMEVDRVDTLNTDGIKTGWKQASTGVLASIPTPYPSLDRHTGGIRLGMPTVLTGRSKAGKSMFLAGWYNYLGRNGIPAMVLPFEDGYDVTITRMAANFGGYKWGKIESGGEWVFLSGGKEWLPVTAKELRFAEECLDVVSKYPIHFLDRAIAPAELLGRVARFKKRHNISAFFVDGAKDFIKPAGKYNDVGFDEESSQLVKRTCRDLNVAGVIVHHLTKIQDHEIISALNIRGSGNIVGDSRSVYALQSMGLEEAGVHVNKDDMGRVTTRRFDCLANNHGSTGSIMLESDLGQCRFYEEHQQP